METLAFEQVTIARVEDGQDGASGTDGRSIVSTTRHYILSETAPTEPSAEWDMTEPTFNPDTDSNKTLYFADCTIFSDGTSAWSEISVSSTYKASKQAYLEAISKPAIFSNTGYVKNSATGEELIVYAYEVTSIIDGEEVSTTNYYMKKDIADTEGNVTATEYYSIASPTATTYTTITEVPPQGQQIDIEPTGMKIGDVWIKGNGDVCAYTADGWQGAPTAAMLESLGSDIGLTDEMLEESRKSVDERLTAAEEDIEKAAQASTVTELQETVNKWNDTAEALNDRLGLTESDLAAMKDNIKIVNATLIIKPTATSETEMVVAAAKIIPYVNGIPVAEFGINGFKGANVMTNDIAFAQKADDGTLTPKWRWITRSNGHLTLKAAD